MFTQSPIQLINSLDTLHSRLELVFDNLKAPSFWIEDRTEEYVILCYKSERKLSLEHFVKGLLLGIFDIFDECASVEILDLDKFGVRRFKIQPGK